MYPIYLFLAFLSLIVAVMAISPSNRYFNTSAVSFTPSGGSLTAITGVTSIAFDEGISTKKEGADFDAFPTVSVTDYHDPTITIDTIDAFALESVLAGQKGSLTYAARDSTNAMAAGGGGRTITMANAQIQGRSNTHPYRDYARRQLVFGAISADGATSPISSVAA